jgi:hypothetical protein
MAAEAAVAAGSVSNSNTLSAADGLGDVLARLTELMEDDEYLHGASTPGSPWLLHEQQKASKNELISAQKRGSAIIDPRQWRIRVNKWL